MKRDKRENKDNKVKDELCLWQSYFMKRDKRENKDNKVRGELCLWQSSFFDGINIHEACIIRI